MADDIAAKIGAHWDQRTTAVTGADGTGRKKEKRPVRWMGHPGICRQLNQRVYGTDQEIWGEGLLDQLRSKYFNEMPFKRAVSVACGTGRKEMRLITLGIVEHFTLFELAESRIKVGQQDAEELGISDKVDFRLANAFEIEDLQESFDLVVWLNALHHMFDTPAAVQWSRDVLKPGGVLMVDDYVGPDRFQWPEEIVKAAHSIRATVPDVVFKKDGDYRPRPRMRRLATAEQVADVDPSEAADSLRIVGAIDSIFPDRELFKVSSGLTVFALSDLASRILDESHDALVTRTLDLDKQFIDQGHLAYIGALAQKP